MCLSLQANECPSATNAFNFISDEFQINLIKYGIGQNSFSNHKHFGIHATIAIY